MTVILLISVVFLEIVRSFGLILSWWWPGSSSYLGLHDFCRFSSNCMIWLILHMQVGTPCKGAKVHPWPQIHRERHCIFDRPIHFGAPKHCQDCLWMSRLLISLSRFRITCAQLGECKGPCVQKKHSAVGEYHEHSLWIPLSTAWGCIFSGCFGGKKPDLVDETSYSS